jgi:hypothetical protein
VVGVGLYRGGSQFAEPRNNDCLAATAIGPAKAWSLSQPIGSPLFLITFSTFAISNAAVNVRVGAISATMVAGLGWRLRSHDFAKPREISHRNRETRISASLTRSLL